MTILGLNAYHPDSAACLIVDGKIAAAAAEERFRRIKHWTGLPTLAIDYCLREARMKLRDVDHVAINRQPGGHGLRRLEFAVTHQANPKVLLEKIKKRRAVPPIKEALEKHYEVSLKAGVHHVEHHLAHIASAYLFSGFNEAACLSIDGFGDFCTAALGFAEGSKIKIDDRIYFPHSLGIFCTAIAQFLGFSTFGDEEKLMSLAAYGEPSFLEQLREVLVIQPDGTFRLNLNYFRHHTKDISYSTQDCAPQVKALYGKKLVDLLGAARRPDEPIEQRHKNIARSAQTIFEKALFELLHTLHKQHPSENLALAGGCAMNSVANGKIHRRTPFKNAYVPCAPGDSGGAIGAAAYVQSSLTSNMRPLSSAFVGPDSTEVEIHAVLDWKRNEIAAERCSVIAVADENELLPRAAEAIRDGKLVGWFQGRMEFGPRALGHRSILADPRNAKARDALNARIKGRESFEPIGLSILREAVGDWFEQGCDVPLMMQTFPIRPKHRALVPAAAHTDGSGRLQTVEAETNPRFHRLIECFHALTDIPMVLNAPFGEDELLVGYPEDALISFLRMKLDALVLGNFFLQRKR
jgi:carbamoyltransferase